MIPTINEVKSCNKVSVGEPAEGSLTNPLPLLCDGNHHAPAIGREEPLLVLWRCAASVNSGASLKSGNISIDVWPFPGPRPEFLTLYLFFCNLNCVDLIE